ncbi:sulfotransferase [Devosia ginsengisoli]|uniref:sulfotransferase family protein n=1 Tax=Devosia ginsengisoli TaxID=400770 RepID=UPI0026EBF848|nr:sulfotransferase [Devosia ginsengisoli]MCR6673604.1 sulfotransferase [Devosia ginsengisoli]
MSVIVPDFLIIGAMKAGTTTLYRDLAAHPELFLPEEKEPECLVRHGNDARAVARDYKSLFAAAGSDRLKGEASTAYAKRPDHEGVAEMARRVCGPLLKVIYITRDPIERIISQYRHEFGLGEVVEDIDTAVLKYARYVNYSRYDWQLEPWLQIFGGSQVLVVPFETYVANRTEIARQICTFLGANPASLPEIDSERAFNANEGKLIPAGPWKRLVGSRFYQRTIKPMLAQSLREEVARRVLSPAQASEGRLAPVTAQALLDQLRLKPASRITESQK